jgi:hypothetical protein
LAVPDWQSGELTLAANLLWVEGRLGPTERACLRSIVGQGHPVTLWHYGPLDGVPEGVTLRDGAEVIPRERLFRHVPTGSYSLFSNLFRYELLRQGYGLWLDCDCYLLKPIEVSGGHVFGWGEADVVAAGVLLLPPDSPVLTELIGYFDAQTIPPWLPPRWRLRYAWQRFRQGRYRIETMPWGNLGPHALTVQIGKFGLSGKVQPQPVFYPWTWREASWVFDSDKRLEDWIKPETLAVHLYNEVIRSRKNDPPMPGSFMERLHREGA